MRAAAMAEDPKPPVTIKAFPPPEDVEEAEKRFLHALGLCVSQWAFVDRQLFRLFRLGLQAATHRAAVIYYSQRTLSQRLQFVDRLMRQNLSPDDYKSNWKPLLKRFDELVPVRNIFVHHPTRRLHTARDGKPVYEYGIHIEPYERLLGRGLPKPMKDKDHLDVGDLVDHAEAVNALEDGLKAFARRLSS
jgi:hypothetical protein